MEYCREDICRLYALVEIVNEHRVYKMKVEPLHLYSITGWHGWTSAGPRAEEWEETEHAWLRSVEPRSESTWKDAIKRKLDAFRAQIHEKRWKPEDATLDGARGNFMRKWRGGTRGADDWEGTVARSFAAVDACYRSWDASRGGAWEELS